MATDKTTRSKTAGKLEKGVVHGGVAMDGKMLVQEGEKSGPPANFLRPKATNVPPPPQAKDRK